MAMLDLWLDADWGDESFAWSQEIPLNMDRMRDDDAYMLRVHDHIKMSLRHLAEEVKEIGLAMEFR